MVDLASVVRPGDGIICGQACAEPQTLLVGSFGRSTPGAAQKNDFNLSLDGGLKGKKDRKAKKKDE